MIKLEIKGISKSYTPGQPVLKPIDLTITPGEFFFLLGPSGCGKSTLLRIIAGFIKPDAGSIHFDSQDVTTMPPEKRDAAMVFQNYALWPHMTVFENVAFGLETRDIRGEIKKNRVMTALEMVRMEEFADRKPASLSGGQQQRVALARAIAVKPKILLLDEPLSNLDAKLRDSMRFELWHICKDSGLTAVYVTHDRKEALSMADRIAVIHNGQIEQLGLPEDLYRFPSSRFAAEFLGNANFFSATVKTMENNFCVIETPFAVLKTAKPAMNVQPGQRCTAMIRPEFLTFSASQSGDNIFEAELHSGAFLGEVSLWNLIAKDLFLTLCELRPGNRKKGCLVKIAVMPENIVLLPEE
jgi:iron(III) transport system ATP-binding protein